MTKTILFLICASSFFNVCSQAEQQQFSIEIMDDEALAIFDPNSEIEIIGSGFEWTEGPLWIQEGNFLLISDIPKNKIFKIDSEGKTSEYLHPSGYSGEGVYGNEPGSNGLLLDQQGNLVLLQHGDRRVAKMKSPINIPKPEYECLDRPIRRKEIQ